MNIVVFVICACVGSFINVVFYSLPKKIDFIKRRSYCDYCFHTLSYIDMIPIINYLFLKGECRYCHHKLNIRYCVVELVSGWIGVIFYNVYNFYSFIFIYLFLMILVLIALIDIDSMYVYDETIVLLFMVGLFVVSIYKLSIMNRLVGMIILSLPMFIFNFYKEAFGGGDIKLFCVLGFVFGIEGNICIFMYSSLLASLYSLLNIMKNELKYDSYIPFIPFITLGVFCFLMYGNIFL